jgi:ATP-dependent Clp protease protease subunit
MSQLKFFAKSNSKKGEIYIYDSIGQSWDGGITADSFRQEMETVKDATELDIYFNSPGGNVFDGIAIQNQIKRHPAKRKTAHIDGIAASIASVIMLACDERLIASNGTVMIHNPSGMCFGTSVDMRKTADTLDGIRDQILGTYVDATGQSPKDLTAWMDDELWMNADLAKQRGFVTGVYAAQKVTAEFQMLKNFGKVPEHLKPKRATDLQAQAAIRERAIQKMRGASPAKA